MINTLIFDLGNVLVHFERDRALRQVAELIPQSQQAIMQFFYNSQDAIDFEKGLITPASLFTKLEKTLNAKLDQDALALAVSDIFWPNEDMIALLHRAKAHGYRLLLLSNTNILHYGFIEQHFDFMHLFDAQILSFKVHAMKPEATIFEATLQVAGCAANECLFTDDLLANIEGAKRCGIDAVLYTDTAAYIAELERRNVIL